ncbi:MAG: bifunctional [glutamate--ammonia ligase]-adenylyl-L-tyrosine phosphorylase/[glutamate--ammonia-ligase] adenylyltransferase [Woeseiaceae bacterium]|nr:bifunctional [glutamate--ammonia ligase]-adenylyl-L-tyrosine phosphorylase/[glutamate--ammonia-ligase] adenylyltransferase [Woeseiaceae bacterium]
MERGTLQTDRLDPLLALAVENWRERFDDANGPDSIPEELSDYVLRAVAASEFAAGVTVKQWPRLCDDLTRAQALPGLIDDFVSRLVDSEHDVAAAKRELRQFRHRMMFRVLADELNGRASTVETLESLSLLADRLIDVAMRLAKAYTAQRFGELLDPHGVSIPLITLGMGKLGGKELNFSSDIDLIFLFPREGESNGRRCVSAQEYCMRWSQQVVGLLDDNTTDGFVFRVDTRLRPFGDSGPPVTSFAALEGYLLQHARTWERYAYVKANIVGTPPADEDRRTLFDELLRPFVYRRYLDYGLFESLREMHRMIDAERRGLGDNVKLGRGGIREIEFIAQSLQLLRGGSRPELQTRSLRSALNCLAGDRDLSLRSSTRLDDAYLFLRKLENFIQARNDRQTHDMPRTEADRAAAAFAMGYENFEQLSAALETHREAVAEEFQSVAHVDDAAIDSDDTVDLWDAIADEQRWLQLLEDKGLPGTESVAKQLAAFGNTCRRLKPDTESQRRLAIFLPRLLELAREARSPSVAIARVLTILEQILKRSAYIALLNENPATAERLMSLCERSTFITEQLARYPVLLDELLDPEVTIEAYSKEALAEDLRLRLSPVDPSDAERVTEELARFQRVSLFRIAVADIGGGLPLMKASDSLTWLAELVLDAALNVAWADMVSRHGEPTFIDGGERQAAGFGIIAYGKLGGLELSYGSDLDLVFLHNSRGEKQVTGGERQIDNAVFFARLVRRLVHILTTRTSSGVLYEIDTRLRPSGHSGLLVTSLDAFERYQREDAWTWEHQALLRARAVAGDVNVAERFAAIRERTLREFVRRDTLKADVVSMRQKMRMQLDRSDSQAFDLKQGEGGIGDIEFIVQYLVLEQADLHPPCIEFSDNIRQLDALAEAGVLELEQATLIQDIYRRYRRVLHHRTLDGADKLVASTDFAEERAVVADLWRSIFIA